MPTIRQNGKSEAVRRALGMPESSHVALETTVHGEHGTEVSVHVDLDATSGCCVLADLHSAAVRYEGSTLDGRGVTLCGDPAALEALGDALAQAARGAGRVRRVVTVALSSGRA